MAITRIKNSSIKNRTPKYDDFLAGLPYRPIIGTASDGGNGTSASVAFTGNNVANGTITYTALSSPGSFTATGTASPITVTGLTSGTAYTFQVKAGNSLGDSAYSAASNSVTPVTPTAYESIASTTASGSVASITFSSIPSSYQHLQLRILCTDTGQNSVVLRFNSDTGSNYARHRLAGNGSTVAAAGTASISNILIGGANDGFSASSLYLGAIICDIHDYASTTKNKTVRSFNGYDANGSGTIELASGVWMNTNAVTSITVSMPSNFTNASTFALYGIKS